LVGTCGGIRLGRLGTKDGGKRSKMSASSEFIDRVQEKRVDAINDRGGGRGPFLSSEEKGGASVEASGFGGTEATRNERVFIPLELPQPYSSKKRATQKKSTRGLPWRKENKEHLYI